MNDHTAVPRELWHFIVTIVFFFMQGHSFCLDIFIDIFFSLYITLLNIWKNSLIYKKITISEQDFTDGSISVAEDSSLFGENDSMRQNIQR